MNRDNPWYNPMAAGTRQDPLWDRNMAIYELANLGWDRRRLSKVFGVTVERVSQIVSREKSRRARVYAGVV